MTLTLELTELLALPPVADADPLVLVKTLHPVALALIFTLAVDVDLTGGGGSGIGGGKKSGRGAGRTKTGNFLGGELK